MKKCTICKQLTDRQPYDLSKPIFCYDCDPKRKCEVCGAKLSGYVENSLCGDCFNNQLDTKKRMNRGLGATPLDAGRKADLEGLANDLTTASGSERTRIKEAMSKISNEDGYSRSMREALINETRQGRTDNVRDIRETYARRFV